MYGWCSARKDGCPTTITCGISEQQLEKIHSGYTDLSMKDTTVDIVFQFNGCCCHKYGKKYGKLRGCNRNEVIKDLTDKKISPTEYTKECLSQNASSHLNIGNTSLVVQSRNSVYNLMREIKQRYQSEHVSPTITYTTCLLQSIKQNRKT